MLRKGSFDIAFSFRVRATLVASAAEHYSADAGHGSAFTFIISYNERICKYTIRAKRYKNRSLTNTAKNAIIELSEKAAAQAVRAGFLKVIKQSFRDRPAQLSKEIR